jgi:hypothetical protein
MEYRPNSGPEKTITTTRSGSEDIGPGDELHNLHFEHLEYLAIKNATEIWEGPRHPAYNSAAARLRSFTNWPKETNPSPVSLSLAGFYFFGKIHCHYSSIKLLTCQRRLICNEEMRINKVAVIT